MALSRRAIALGLLLAACRQPTHPSVGVPTASYARYGVVVSRDVMVAMRDGVHLATDVYRPALDGAPVEERFPALLERTPYGKENASPFNLAGAAAFFVARGYVVVVQDVRGRHGSEGRWRPHVDDVRDGFDTAAWIGAQPWSSGAIGAVGTSYPGGTAHALAISGAPYLAAMVPVDAMSNCGRYGVRHAGAFELRWLNWILTFGNPWVNDPLRRGLDLRPFYPARDAATRQTLAALADHVVEYAKRLPLRPGTTPLHAAPEYESWLIAAMGHGDYDAFWKDMGSSVVDHVGEYKDIPVYHVSGWYDSWAAQVADLNYVELSKAKRSPQRLIMGPWTHGGQRLSYAGEAEFGPDAALDLNALRLRWFDRWLKRIDNGVDREPPVRIFVMGGAQTRRTPEGRVFVGGRWRDEREWPLARTRPTPYYLHADGSLSDERPIASSPTRYRFDPRHPVPSIGGNVSSQGPLMFAGAADQRCRADLWTCDDTRPLSARRDVLVFQTPALDHDVEVTGRVIVRLWAASSALDTDFTAKLVDVYPPSADFPAGVALNVADGIVRARYRASLEKATLMKPGAVYAFTIEMYPTALVFPRGHRIRVDVSSSNFPRFDVNPNTGEPLNANRRWAVAENSVYHDLAHPSHVLLPIVPPDADAPSSPMARLTVAGPSP